MWKVSLHQLYQRGLLALIDCICEEEAEKKKQEANATQAYVRRVIFHPNFKNISYDQLAAMEPELEVGGHRH